MSEPLTIKDLGLIQEANAMLEEENWHDTWRERMLDEIRRLDAEILSMSAEACAGVVTIETDGRVTPCGHCLPCRLKKLVRA